MGNNEKLFEYLRRTREGLYTAYKKFCASQPMSDACLLDPDQNRDMKFWRNYLDREPLKGKAILQQWLMKRHDFRYPEGFFHFSFLLKYDLEMPDSMLPPRLGGDWENGKEYLRRRLERGPDLSPELWGEILSYQVLAAEDFTIPWKKFSADIWARLLREHPQFAGRCSKFRKFTTANWCDVLQKAPELAKYCKCWDAFFREEWLSICYDQPRFLDHPANDKLTLDDRLDFALLLHLRKAHRASCGPGTSRKIRLDEAEIITARVSDAKTGFSKRLRIEKTEIDRVLSEFWEKVIAESDTKKNQEK